MLARTEVFYMSSRDRLHELGEAYARDFWVLLYSFLSYTQVISGCYASIRPSICTWWKLSVPYDLVVQISLVSVAYSRRGEYMVTGISFFLTKWLWCWQFLPLFLRFCWFYIFEVKAWLSLCLPDKGKGKSKDSKNITCDTSKRFVQYMSFMVINLY